ncbi:hypothetical protein FRACYDRAFT_154562, partial [Fragilariopsis cylindrus CCMP1102]
WIKFYKLLTKYQIDNNGNTNVPRHCNGNKQLGSWVKRQRSNYKLGKLAHERIQLLNDINFCWNKQIPWNDMYQKLIQYKSKYGTTRVTKSKEEELFLFSSLWIFRQRALFQCGKLPKNRIEKLNSIGFLWD